MFLAGIRVTFVFEGAKGGDNAGAGDGWLGDGIDVAAFGGDKRIGKALAKFGDFLLAKFFALGFGGFCQFAFVDNVYGPFGAHDGNFRGGPGEVSVSADVFTGHDAIRAAVRLARDYGDLRNGGFGESE